MVWIKVDFSSDIGVYEQKGFNLFCYVNQYGRHPLCHLNLWELNENNLTIREAQCTNYIVNDIWKYYNSICAYTM